MTGKVPCSPGIPPPSGGSFPGFTTSENPSYYGGMKKMRFILPVFLLVLLLLSFSGIGRNGAQAESGNSDIWIITDIHYLSDKLRDQGPVFTGFIQSGDGKNILRIDAILSGFYASVEKNRPAALLVTGDLTFNGEKQSHRDLAKWFRKIESLGTRVYVIPGNHDINNPWARKITEDEIQQVPGVSPEEFARIYRNFGYKNALSYDPASLSYLIEPVPGFLVFMLDSCRYDRNLAYGVPVGSGAISSETREWITERVRDPELQGKNAAVAMHHTLLEHNPMVSDGFTVNDSENLQDFFSTLGLRTFLSGHIHIQDIIHRERADGRILDITTNALSVYPHNYGVLSLSRKNPEYTAVSLSDSPEHIEQDVLPSLRSFFIQSSDQMVRKTLDAGLYSADEIDRMSEFLSLANLNFFAGREDPHRINPETLELFRRDGSSFLRGYLESILRDLPPGDQSEPLEL